MAYDKDYYSNMQRKTYTQPKQKKAYKTPKATVYKSERPPKEKRSREHGASVSVRTNVFGLVSIILIIGMIATVFFAYNNARGDKGNFQFFSPSVFLNNISSVEGFINYQICEMTISPFSTSPTKGAVYKGVITYGFSQWKSSDSYYTEPITIHSNNTLSMYQIQRGSVFEFTIGGKDFYSQEFSAVNANGEVESTFTGVEIPYTEIEMFVMPDFEDVRSAWEDVSKEGNFFEAVKTTLVYVGDLSSYNYRILTSFLPWNSVQTSSNVDVSIPWRDESNNYIIN